MTTQYSPILKLALPVQGELSGTWGDVVNDNITSMVEQAIAGRAVINTWSTNSHTLTSANGTTSESRCAMLELTDTGTSLSAAGTVICPALSKIYIVKNAAGQNVTVKTASGTGILVPNGRTTFLFCDGTNVVEAMTHTTSLQLGTSTTVTAVLDEDNMASNSATALSTQQSIKAYVDAQVATSDTLSEVLANGNTTGGTDLAVSSGDDITFADSSKAIFGAGSDLQIYHDGSNSYIHDVGTGNINIEGRNIFIVGANTDTNLAGFIDGAEARLYYNGSQKLSTTSTGIDVTGGITATDGSTITVTDNTDVLTLISTDADENSGPRFALTRNSASPADNDYVGLIAFNSENSADESIRMGMIRTQILDVTDGTEDSTLTFYSMHGGVETQRIATTSTGIDVTGTVTADGLTVEANAPYINISNTGENVGGIKMYDSGGASTQYFNLTYDSGASNTVGFDTGASGEYTFSVNTSEKMRIDSSGRVGIGTSSPSQKAEVSNNANSSTWLKVSNSDTGIGAASGILLGNNTGDAGAISLLSGAGDGSLFLRTLSTNALKLGTNNTEKMRIDSSGRVGIGTSSIGGSSTTKLHLMSVTTSSPTVSNDADELIVEGSGHSGMTFLSTLSTNIRFGDAADSSVGQISYTHSDNSLMFGTNNTERMRITSTGQVGIGTSSPRVTAGVIGLTIGNSTTGGSELVLRENTGNDWRIFNNGYLGFIDDNTERMRIDESGRVGIGTISPATTLEVNGDIGIGRIVGGYTFRETVGGNERASLKSNASNELLFNIGASTEAMRIDSSGNLLVGKTTSSSATAGITLEPAGAVVATRDGGECLIANRKTSDGTIIQLRKDQTTVGSIGTYGSRFLVGTGNTALQFNGTNSIWPSQANNNLNDGVIDLGVSNARFKDAYLAGGVYLGGTGSANKLDEYEEGTWTPVLTFGGANVGMTGTFIGKYIKVGNLLTVSGQITLTAKGSSTGNTLVTGLPFSTGTTAVMSFTNYHLSYNSMIYGQIFSNQFPIYETTTGGTRTSIDDTNFSADTSLSFSATYALT